MGGRKSTGGKPTGVRSTVDRLRFLRGAPRSTPATVTAPSAMSGVEGAVTPGEWAGAQRASVHTRTAGADPSAATPRCEASARALAEDRALVAHSNAAANAMRTRPRLTNVT